MNRLLALILMSSMAWAQQQSAPAPSAVPAAAAPSAAVPAANHRELLPDLPPLPEGKATRIGGNITLLDEVLDTLEIQPFGGSEVRVTYDARTRVFRGDSQVSVRELRNGQRIAVDTVLDEGRIFARSIHILSSSSTGESHGQVVSYNAAKNELVVRDPLIPRPVKLRLASYTQVLRDDQAVSRQELAPGMLVAVDFVADGKGNAFAHRVSILATTGRTFAFPGKVTYVDLHTGLLVVTDPSTKTNHEIHFNPGVLRIPSNLQEGSDVTVTASFEGNRYLAREITVNAPPAP